MRERERKRGRGGGRVLRMSALKIHEETCNMLQRTATRCNMLQRTATHWFMCSIEIREETCKQVLHMHKET